MKIIRYIIALVLAGLSHQTFAYPNFVGYGYTSCLTCHYNPFGNGPLTDYGRALGATTIADNILYADTPLDKVGERSGFMFKKHSNTWLRPSVDYRGLYLKRDIDNDLSESIWIHMDANVNLVLRMGPKDNKDKFIASFTLGYSPLPTNGQFEGETTFRTREHYLGYRFNENWGLYAGLMDKVYGIRIPDHNTFARTITANTQNDQTHSLLLHYTSPSFDIGLQPFVGNMAEDDVVRQKGLAATIEYTLNNQARPGASFQMSESEFLKQYAAAIHTRLGFGKGNSIMGEIGIVKEEQIKRLTENTSRYWMLQTHLLLRKGFFILNTVEYLKANTENESKTLRWGPGVQYFIAQGLELRMDLYNTRVFSETSVSNDVWDLTAQVHLWF